MTDIALTVLSVFAAYWYGGHRRDNRARDIFFDGVRVVDTRTCTACGVRVPGSAIEIGAHALQHQFSDPAAGSEAR
jgi:hypothetical protein